MQLKNISTNKKRDITCVVMSLSLFRICHTCVTVQEQQEPQLQEQQEPR